MAGESLYFGRAYRLTLEGKEFGSKIFETQGGLPALDIKFDVEYARGCTSREGTVSVLGLSYQTISSILALSAIDRARAYSEMIHIKLEAGYQTGAGLLDILDGYVYKATVTAPPEMWIKMKVAEYNPYCGNTIQFDSDPELMPIRPYLDTILQKYSKIEGVQFKVVDKTRDKLLDSKVKRGISLKGNSYTLRGIIAKLSEELSPEVMFIMRTYAASGNERIIEVHAKSDKEGSTGPDIHIDKDNGLLSVTGIDAVQGTITAFLDGRCDDQLSHMVLKSQLNPEANGKYLIVRKQYVGHYRGKEWYVRYSCKDRVVKS